MTGQFQRTPGTYAYAMRRMMDIYGVEECAEMAGAKVRDIYDYSDPRSTRRPSIMHCERWDARRIADGREPLFFNVYGARLTVDQPPGKPLDPVEATTAAIKETSEGINAYLMSTHRDLAPTEQTHVLTEIEEAVEALNRLANDVRGYCGPREVPRGPA